MTSRLKGFAVRLLDKFLNWWRGGGKKSTPLPPPEEPVVVAPPPPPPPPPIEETHDSHTHPVGGDILASSVVAVPTTFDKSAYLEPAASHTNNETDGEGAFRILGNVSHFNYDDAIVFPGQRGAAHLHMYWGNTQVNADTTYESLRKNGNGTTEGGPLNRSSYWTPAVLLGETVLIPDHITMYYKRLPDMSNEVHTPLGATEMVDLPRGLRMITRGGSYVVHRLSGGAERVAHTELAALLPTLKPGDFFGIEVNFPTAWDGQRVDSADHMSHMAHLTRHPDLGKLQAPSTHTKIIVSISQKIMFTVRDGEDWTKFRLSSDSPTSAPGSTLHADYFEGWDDEIRTEWHDNALERMLNCNGGDLGSGRRLKRPPSFSFAQVPNRLPLSSIPVGGELRLID